MGADVLERISRLEAAMVVIKSQQFEHECQLDTLALEVHALGDKVDQMVTKKEFQEFEKRFRRSELRIDARFERIDATLKVICDALAI